MEHRLRRVKPPLYWPGAIELPVELIDEKDPAKLGSLSQASQHVPRAWTDQVLPSPVREGVKQGWYPIAPAYNAQMADGLVLDSNWQPVVKGSKTTVIRPIDLSKSTSPVLDHPWFRGPTANRMFFFSPDPIWIAEYCLTGANKMVLSIQQEDGKGGYTGYITPFLDWVLEGRRAGRFVLLGPHERRHDGPGPRAVQLLVHALPLAADRRGRRHLGRRPAGGPVAGRRKSSTCRSPATTGVFYKKGGLVRPVQHEIGQRRAVRPS